jgi:3'-5' exoribonuclease
MDFNVKGVFVKDIKDSQQVDALFLLTGMNKAETRAGKTYLTLKIMDRSGEISGRVWDRADYWFDQVKVGQVVRVCGQAQSYRDILQLKVNSLESVTEQEIDMALFVPATSFNIEEMARELRKFARSITDEYLNKLLLKFLLNKKFMAAFCQAPAAKRMHHAYVGGLLEHTLHVTRLADRVAELYPSVDRSLLLAGAILHDVGKISEFSFAAYPVDYSDKGRLMGHMVLGVEMIGEKIKKIKEFPPETAMRLKHLILSHHGRYEFGSPALPMLHEAFILNFVDDMDAKINYMERLSGQVEEGYHWSEYQRNMERFCSCAVGSRKTSLRRFREKRKRKINRQCCGMCWGIDGFRFLASGHWFLL